MLTADDIPRFEEVSGPPELLRPYPSRTGSNRRHWARFAAVGLGALTAAGFVWFATRPSEADASGNVEFARPADERTADGTETAGSVEVPSGADAAAVSAPRPSAAVTIEPSPTPDATPAIRSPTVEYFADNPRSGEGSGDPRPPNGEAPSGAKDSTPSSVPPVAGKAKLTIEVFGDRPAPAEKKKAKGDDPPPGPGPTGSGF